MLTLARGQIIHLPPARGECSRVFAPHAEQKKLGHVAEVETYAASVRAAVLADFVPDKLLWLSPFEHLART